jgi:TRAP-type mannitol/chloroaromatic compound transport system permease large subunit
MRNRRRSSRRSVWFWVLVAIVVVVVLGLFFGGYRKGTKVGSLGTPGAVTLTTTGAMPDWVR